MTDDIPGWDIQIPANATAPYFTPNPAMQLEIGRLASTLDDIDTKTHRQPDFILCPTWWAPGFFSDWLPNNFRLLGYRVYTSLHATGFMPVYLSE